MTVKRSRISKPPTRARKGAFPYDVCLSFAGEDRSYVDRVARELTKLGIRVFYDKHEEVTLWGKDLYDHLDYVYRKAARFCVLFISRRYASKVWTNHERRSMQSRALRENAEYILPVRFDSTELPGIRDTLGYLGLKNRSPQQLANLIVTKIGSRQRYNFLPPYPDRLYRRMKARKSAEKEEIYAQLRSFYESWERMEPDERRVVTDLLFNACADGLPKNFHMNLDLLRRETGFPTPKIEHILGNLSSLGFSTRIRQSKRPIELVPQRFVELEFSALTTAVQDLGPHNPLLQAICDEFKDMLCLDCARLALLRGDFSQLSSSTVVAEKHRRAARE